MDMSHELVQEWLREKLNLPAGTKLHIDQETKSEGYCDTCWYEYEVWVVKDEKGKELHTFSDDLASVLNEVLTWAQNRTTR